MLNVNNVCMILLVQATGLAVTHASAQVTDRPDETPAVTEAIEAYFRGGTYGDIASFRRAFHSKANVMYVEDGEYRSWTLIEYLDLWTPGQRLDRETRILDLDVTGNAASAKVEAVYETHRFVDYLSLLKVDGEWRIVSKIFYREDF
ncbi:MAG: nuclear transport factor 2 family protein [Gemmatimonadota bacterium]|nr:MAG: nuclear transport factor 2 family protein [Gemmatimonadota bacterium]